VVWTNSVPGPRSQPIWPASEYGSTNRSQRAHFQKRSCSVFLELYDKWKPTRRCVAKGRPRPRNRGHKSPLLQTMAAVLHYNFLLCAERVLTILTSGLSWPLIGHKVYNNLVIVPHSNILQVAEPSLWPKSKHDPQGGRRSNFG